ncbi:MAG: GPP34 family phosphoprotein [Methylophilales bacterium]|nr:GPP34 family phosphoprotein [Methylophilales bacterium]
MSEELLLITLDDESGKLLDSIKPFSFDIAIAASLIMELTLKGKLDTDAEKLFVVSSEETGDAILDQALAIIVAEKNSLSTSDWLSRFAHYGDTLSDKIIESLVNKGVVQLVEKRLLWVLKTRAYPATSGIEEREVRSRIMQLLNNDEIPNPSDALLIGLLRATGIMNRLLSSTELVRLQNRIDQIANLEEINRSLSASVQEAWKSIISQVPPIF